MSRVFISHSQKNNASALALAQWLAGNGWDDYFLDISADRGISPGERWQEALRRAADRCQAVLFLISPEWVASRWCLAEFLLAKQLGKAIFGVLVSETPMEAVPVEMRGEFQLANLVDGVERERLTVEFDPLVPRSEVSFSLPGLSRLRIGLENAGLDPLTFPWPPIAEPDRSPYRGLRSMEAIDAAVFFGRDASITLALDSLRRLRETRTERLFAIVGASGTGKSSFLRSGLLPRLARDDRHFFVLPVVRPEREPINGANGLISCLERAYRSAGEQVGRARLRARLSSPKDFVAIVSELQQRAQSRIISSGSAPPTVVLALDQAEELFSGEERSESDLLLHILRECMESGDEGSGPLIFVLFGIRSDSYERLQTHPDLAHLKQHVFSLQPIPREEYRVVIEGPAERHRAAGHQLRIDPLLTQQLLVDTQGADALPLLAFTLERLYLEQGELSLAAYEAMGGVAGSIEAAVQAAFSDPGRTPEVSSSETERNRLLQAAFIPWLARVDPDTEERKRRVAAWDEIPSESRPLVLRLIEQRLLTRDRRIVVGGAEESIVVEVAHEALLRRWPMLTAWLDRDADALRTIEVSRRAAAEWLKHGKSAAWLDHAGDRLKGVETLLERQDLERLLGEDGRLYIRACRRRDDENQQEQAAQQERLRTAEHAAEQERLRVAQAEAAQNAERAVAARRLSRRTMTAAAIVTVFLIVASWSAITANRQRRAAEHSLGELDVADALRLEKEGSLPQVLAHLARAVRLDPSDPVWRGYLIRLLNAGPWIPIRADLPTSDPVHLTVFGPSGTIVFIGAGDSGYLLDSQTGARIGKRFRHRNLITAAAFSRNEKLLVTGSRDRTIRLWNATNAEPVGKPMAQAWAPESVGFSPGGGHIFVTGDGAARVLRTSDGAELWRPRNAGGLNPDVSAISPDGSVAVVVEPARAIFWNIDEEHSFILPVAIMGNDRRVTFSRRGSLFVVQSNSGMQVFETRTGKSVGPLSDLKTAAVLIDEDCDCGVVWGRGGLASFSVRAGKMLSPGIKIGEGEKVRLADIEAHGSRLVAVTETYQQDQPRRLHIWDATTGEELSPELSPQRGGEFSVCGDGSALLSWSGNSARVWALANGTAGSPRLTHPGGAITSAAFSADCRSAVTSGGRETRLWEIPSGKLIAQPIDDVGDVRRAQFSPDGHALITSSATSARLWDLHLRHAQSQVLRQPAGYDVIAYCPSGDCAITASADRFEVSSAAAERPNCPPTSVGDRITALLPDRNGDRVMLSTRGGLNRIYDLKTCKQFGHDVKLGTKDELLDTGDRLSALDPDGTVLMTAEGKVASLWEFASGKRLGQLMTHPRAIRSVDFSGDGKYVLTASDDASVRVWSAGSGKPVGKPMRHNQGLKSAIFNADSSRVCSLAYRRVKQDDSTVSVPRDVQVWDVHSGQAVGPAIVHDADVTRFAISPDGTRVVTTTGTEVRVWDSLTGKPVGNALVFTDEISDLSFSSDGMRMITAAGQSATLWDASTLSAIGPPFQVPDPIVSASFVPNGQTLLVMTEVPRPKIQPPTEDDSDDGSSPHSDGSDEHGADQKREAWLADVSTGTPKDAPLLTALAELVGGFRINDLGALEATSRRSPVTLLALAKGNRGGSVAGRLVGWMFGAYVQSGVAAERAEHASPSGTAPIALPVTLERKVE